MFPFDFLKKWSIMIIMIVLCFIGVISILYAHEKGSLANVGDALNGLLGPVLTLISIILIYKTYTAAIEANKEIAKGNLLSQIQHEINDFTQEIERVSKIIENTQESVGGLTIYGVLLYENVFQKDGKRELGEGQDKLVRVFLRAIVRFNQSLIRFTIIQDKYSILNNYLISHEIRRINLQYRTLRMIYGLIINYSEQKHIQLSAPQVLMIAKLKSNYETTKLTMDIILNK